ncbi:hypothetical protein BDR04DRAFT_1123901 [Suillus decipiens]|nr:hypothetical protein BDR04DRAFT_1123901 [Suillus decipiens]
MWAHGNKCTMLDEWAVGQGNGCDGDEWAEGTWYNGDEWAEGTWYNGDEWAEGTWYNGDEWAEGTGYNGDWWAGGMGCNRDQQAREIGAMGMSGLMSGPGGVSTMEDRWARGCKLNGRQVGQGGWWKFLPVLTVKEKWMIQMSQECLPD